MTKLNLDLDTNFSIVEWWAESHSDYTYIYLQYTDGTYFNGWVNKTDWKNVKDAELRSDIDAAGGVV